MAPLAIALFASIPAHAGAPKATSANEPAIGKKTVKPTASAPPPAKPTAGTATDTPLSAKYQRHSVYLPCYMFSALGSSAGVWLRGRRGCFVKQKNKAVMLAVPLQFPATDRPVQLERVRCKVRSADGLYYRFEIHDPKERRALRKGKTTSGETHEIVATPTTTAVREEGRESYDLTVSLSTKLPAGAGWHPGANTFMGCFADYLIER